MLRCRPAAPSGWCARPLVCRRLNDSRPDEDGVLALPVRKFALDRADTWVRVGWIKAKIS